jgi:methylphosphotriester-DNA--protein-cysteine methyltransferase
MLSCGHEHGTGDRCVSFSYTPEFCQRLATDAGTTRMSFKVLRIPPIRALFPSFGGLTSTTPHQYLLRLRLRRAAIRLKREPTRILDIALDCGFGDVSNFNHAFRAEFGVSPRVYRSRLLSPAV